MGVSPAYVGKLLKGQENLTLETISNIESVIGQSMVSICRPYEMTAGVSLAEVSSFTVEAKSPKFSSTEKFVGSYASATHFSAGSVA